MDLDSASVPKYAKKKNLANIQPSWPKKSEYWSIINIYYMAVSHKDWELPNSRIWFAEIDIDRGLDFPI